MKSNYTRKLGQYNNGDCERYWYYRKKMVSKWGNVYYEGHFCLNCKEPLPFGISKLYDYQPSRNHGSEIKRVKMEREKNWIPLSKEVVYYRALCCRCVKNCDCLIYLERERKNFTITQFVQWTEQIKKLVAGCQIRNEYFKPNEMKN